MVSVCIATYNGEKYIKEQLKSILIQLNDTDEIIISDDHSTDETIKIVKSISDDRLKLFFNNKESGYTKNFENALEKAKGDFIFLSDQDDIWIDDKVVKTLEKLKNSDFVVCDADIVNADLNPTGRTVFKSRKVKKGFINTFIKIRYLGCCMAFKKEVLQKALPFPMNQKLVTHDSWISLVSEMFFKVQLLYEPLIKYRRHGNNTSLGGEKGNNSVLKKIQIRGYSLYHLLKIVNR